MNWLRIASSSRVHGSYRIRRKTSRTPVQLRGTPDSEGNERKLEYKSLDFAGLRDRMTVPADSVLFGLNKLKAPNPLTLAMLQEHIPEELQSCNTQRPSSSSHLKRRGGGKKREGNRCARRLSR